MSGESAQHVHLVERLIATIESQHKTVRGIVVLADHHKFVGNRPPTIAGFQPDVFAQDVPETFRVIGEAKTPKDFSNDRSIRQIAAFLDHLALYPNSTFYLAVPWYLKGRANYIMHELSRPLRAAIKINVLPFV